MEYVSQEGVWSAVDGRKITDQVCGGKSVVFMSYGYEDGHQAELTPWGKGHYAYKDAAAWFKQSEPSASTGLVPRIVHRIFQEKRPDCTVTLRRFQNIVDDVRDLLPPPYKGKQQRTMVDFRRRKGAEVDWLKSKVIASYGEFASEFLACAVDRRTVCASTQLNPLSTRGHIFTIIEVATPDPAEPGTTQRGYLYVCDLQSGESPKDLRWTDYERDKDDGSATDVVAGVDEAKTSSMVDQAKKIQISIAEIAHYFEKHEEGKMTPGCTTYFPMKYLKEVMEQEAESYVFAGIRPEAKYLPQTAQALELASKAHGTMEFSSVIRR